MKQITYTEFENQVVFVTGVASGIGFEQARAFLEQGASVFGMDQKYGEMTQLVREYPKTFRYRLGDVRDNEALKKAYDQCLDTFEKIDILLNTAGQLDGYQPILATSDELWETIFAVNVSSMFHLIKLVLPEMLNRQQGTIINMASIAGLVAGSGGCAYTASKHAIVGLTKQLALDYADQGIHVNAIAPGAIRTPMNAADFEGTAEMALWVENETPLKRWAEPAEVAQLTLFLSSQQSAYLQGNIMPIDGGWLLK